MLPIVFIHGIRLSKAAWVTQLSTVGAHHPVSAIDLPGHGANIDTPFTMPAAVAEVAKSLNDAPAVVVGHSLGGYVAMATAAAHPNLVAGLVIAGSTTVPSRGTTTPFLVMHKLMTQLPDNGQALSARIYRSVLPPEVAAAVTSGPIATAVIPSVVAALRAFNPLAALATYSGPVSFINGGHDHLRLHEKKFVAANARLTVIPGTGHYLPMTHPALFTSHVLDFATKTEARSQR
jgi:pimeloyl-ACP methyl ester carboxylesterase